MNNLKLFHQELLKHQIKVHGVKPDGYIDAPHEDKSPFELLKGTGAILPESAHTIECKVCNREFHAQSRNAALSHLRKEHEIEPYNNKSENRY